MDLIYEPINGENKARGLAFMTNRSIVYGKGGSK